MNDITPIVQVTTNGLTQLQQLGLAGVFLSFIFIGGFFIIRYLSVHCEKRTDAALAAYKEDAAANRDVLRGVEGALNGVQLTIAKIEGKIGA